MTGNLIGNPGTEEGLGNWLRLEGTWSNRSLSGPDPEIGTNYFRAAVPGGRTSQLSQTVSLAEFENTIRTGSQQLVLSALLRTSRATASGHVELEFRDSLGRVVGSAQTQSASSISQWQKQLLTIEVPKSATEVQVILSGAAAGTSADVYFDEISLQPISPQFFEFEVEFDPDQDVALDVTGIDFWQQGVAGGPTAWELRSSRDDFRFPLAGGSITTAALPEHQQQSFSLIGADDHTCLAADDTPITFRIYAIGGDGQWTIDNLSLTGQVHPLFECPAAPIAADDGPFNQRNDSLGIYSVLDNDFDINVNAQTEERLSIVNINAARRTRNRDNPRQWPDSLST